MLQEMYWQYAGLNQHVKVMNDPGGFRDTLLQPGPEILGSALGLKLSDLTLTEVYTKPKFVYSRFLCAVIGYCSTVILSKHCFKYRDSNISVALTCYLLESCLIESTESGTPKFEMSLH